VPLQSLTLDKLTIDDEPSFRHVALYDDLKQALLRDAYRFRVLPPGTPSARWDRALFLNLTFWDVAEAGDVLVEDHIPADVVAHAAWHHLTRRALLSEAKEGAAAGAVTADGLFLGEAIASAFDLYLVGRLLGHAPDSDFLQTQVPAMAEVAEAAGPERAFEDLRALLFDAATALVRCKGVAEAAEALERLDGHRFAPLLHHYELSTWVLYAKAYAKDAPGEDEAARAVDAALRSAPDPLLWLEERWLRTKKGAEDLA
jgi:hypothetical protein